MKFDKDTAIKHHFWLLLGLAVPLTLVCLVALLFVVSAQIRKNRADLENAHKSVNAASGSFKNQKWVDDMRAAADAMKKEEELVWGKAYDAQAKLFTWPTEFEKRFHFQDGFFPLSIKVSRKVPADKTSVDDAKPPQHRLRGEIIEKKDEDTFVVGYAIKAGKKIVPMPPATFYRTPEITNSSSKKITSDDGKALNFVDLQVGDWVDVVYEIGKYFGDPLTNKEQEEFAVTYLSQIEPIIAQVKPVTANGQGVEQLPGWFFKPGEPPPAGARFFRFVSKEWNIAKNFSDEAWIAQEDIWIQRELYRLVRLANDYVSKFKGETGGDPKQWQTFTNPYWQIDLKLSGPTKLSVKITNLLPERQKLDLPFLINLHEPSAKQPPEQIIIGGRDPLNPGESHDASFNLDKLDRPPTGFYGVEQVINWETAAIKRIDHISIGSMDSGDCSHSDRTYPVGVKTFKKAPAARGAQGGQPGGMPGGQPGGQPGGMPGGQPGGMPGGQPGGMPGGQPGGMPGGQPGGDGKGQKGSEVLPHGMHAARYSDVTRQSRLVPVGISLIVDQDHIDRVLLAFTNSPLRFLTTQVIMNRYPRSLRPSLNLGTARAGDDNKEVNPAEKSGMKKGGFGGFGGRGGFGQGFFMPGGVRAQSTTSGGDSSESDMELVIYGIVTLYERYPPRK